MNSMMQDETMDRELSQKIENLKVQNRNLKEQINSISFRIEETIQNVKTAKENEKQAEDFTAFNEEYVPIQKKINKYKELISDIKNKMDGFYNLRKIEQTENEIKAKRDELAKLKYENNVLNNINKNQNKAMAQYELKYENKNEVKVLTEKLKILREEFKYSKDLLKSTEAKIKSQNLYILNTEIKCQKIKENIEFKKRNKETPSIANPEARENLNATDTENLLGNSVFAYEEQMRFSEIQINSEEKNYKSEIARQQLQIAKMTEDINLLTIQLKEKEQDIRINDLKLKELKKINKHQQDQQRQQELQENENADLPQNLRMQVNYNSINYRHQRNQINKTGGNRPNSTNIRQIPVPATVKQQKHTGSKTPATTLGRGTKPFSKNDIKFDLRNKNSLNDNYAYGTNASNNIGINSNNKNVRFNYNRNYASNSDVNNNTSSTNVGNPRRAFNRDILNNNYDVNMQKNLLLMQRDDMLNEIESLKNELKYTLEKNENVALIDRDKLAEEMKTNDVNHNYNDFNNREIMDFTNINKGDIHE